MLDGSSLTTAEILAEFTDAIAGHQGRVTDTFDDGCRLFTRAIVPQSEAVKPGDQLQGGVALKATDAEVCVYPYVFRLVCKNGAIMAQAIEVRPVELHLLEPEEAREAIHDAVGACCAEGVFTDTVVLMRNGCTSAVDAALNILPVLAQLSQQAGPELISKFMDNFFRDGDRSQFGLANAITAVARDTRDPARRWDLEELGGAIAIGRVPTGPIPRSRSLTARAKRTVLVG